MVFEKITYCNLSSPYVKDSEGVKYIDYDLDVKVFPSGDKIILDRDEFEFNQVDYQYPKKLIQIVESEMKDLIKRIDEHEIPFNSDIVLKDYGIYLNLKKQMNRKKSIKSFRIKSDKKKFLSFFHI